MAGHPSPTDPRYWKNDYRPPGGFVNFIQNPYNNHLSQYGCQQHMSQNSHFVGATLRYTPMSTPQMNRSGGSPSFIVMDSPHEKSEKSNVQSQTINAANKDDEVECRTEKRLIWTLEEDQILISGWLNNSNDPIMGNNKKNEQYWKDVLKEYNKNTPKSRHREWGQAKIRWHRLNKLVNQYHSCWTKAENLWPSGHSDEQLTEKAQELHVKEYGGLFLNVSMWKAVKMNLSGKPITTI